jgi:DNA-binding CsgD family transcriptional regulator
MTYKNEDFVVNQDFDIKSIDYRKIKKYIPGISQFASLVKSSIIIFDYYKHNFYFISNDNQYFTEVEPKKYQKYSYKEYNNIIHPDDMVLLYKMHHRAFMFAFSQPIENRKNLALYYTIRLKNIYDEYVLTDVQIKILETDSKGNIWTVMFMLKESSLRYPQIPYVSFVNDSIKHHFTEEALINFKLTDNQIEILKMLSVNSTLNEICVKLNIPENTILSHLQIIYNKLGVTNSNEAVFKFLNCE